MEEKKTEIAAKWREVKIQMRVFTVNHLKPTNRKARYPIVSEEIKTLLVNLLNLYEELFDMILDKNGDEMKVEQEKCTQQEGEIQDFLSNLEDRYYELEAEEASTSNISVPSMASLEEAIKEQPEDSRRREEEEKRVRKEKERIMKEKTEAKFRVISEGLREEAELIFSLATRVPLSTWKNVEDIKIKQSMREIKDWEDNVEKLRQRETDLIAQMADADIIPDDIPR